MPRARHAWPLHLYKNNAPNRFWLGVLLFSPILLHKRLDRNYQRGVHHAADGPDEPTVLRLAVSLGAEGVPQEDSDHHQPVGGSQRVYAALDGFVWAGVVALLQQLIHGVLHRATRTKA